MNNIFHLFSFQIKSLSARVEQAPNTKRLVGKVCSFTSGEISCSYLNRQIYYIPPRRNCQEGFIQKRPRVAPGTKGKRQEKTLNLTVCILSRFPALVNINYQANRKKH